MQAPGNHGVLRGEKLPDFCGNCDSCLRPKGTFDGTEAAIKLMNCIQELNQRFGTNYVIDVLTGSKNKKIKQNRHEKLKSHTQRPRIYKRTMEVSGFRDDRLRPA